VVALGLPARVEQDTHDEAWNAERSARDAALQRLAAAGRVRWAARYDWLTDRPALAWGSVPFVPASADDPSWSALGVEPSCSRTACRAAMLDALDARARVFVA
jgi:hypothetical protein